MSVPKIVLAGEQSHEDLKWLSLPLRVFLSKKHSVLLACSIGVDSEVVSMIEAMFTANNDEDVRCKRSCVSWAWTTWSKKVIETWLIKNVTQAWFFDWVVYQLTENSTIKPGKYFWIRDTEIFQSISQCIDAYVSDSRLTCSMDDAWRRMAMEHTIEPRWLSAGEGTMKRSSLLSEDARMVESQYHS